jgi:hypothetical protein
MDSANSPTVQKQKLSLLKRISHSYTKNWKPVLAAKAHLDDEYTFTLGPRRGAPVNGNHEHATSKWESLFKFRMRENGGRCTVWMWRLCEGWAEFKSGSLGVEKTLYIRKKKMHELPVFQRSVLTIHYKDQLRRAMLTHEMLRFTIKKPSAQDCSTRSRIP